MAYTSNVTTILQDVATTPAVYNYLRPNAFRFTIKDIPNVAYTCQSANLPALQLGYAVQQNPFNDIPVFGDKLTYGDFTIRFLIAEDMSNYLELFEWLIAIGFPNDYNDYKAFVGTRLDRFPFYKTSSGKTDTIMYSDGTLTILDSNNIAKKNIILQDLFPVSVETLDFDVTVSAVDYFVGVASFKYSSFVIESV